jgi:oligosaccharide repeat unit polymerase
VIGLALVMYPGALIDARALGLIVMLCALFSMCSFIALQTARRSTNTPGTQVIIRGHTRLFPVLAISSVLAGGAAAINVLRSGDVASGQSLAQVASSLAVQRYAGDLEAGALTPLANTVIFVASLVCPFSLLTSSPRRNLYLVAPVLSSVPYAVLSTARLGLLLSAAFSLSALLAAVTLRYRRFPRIALRPMLASVFALIVVAAIFTGSAYLRAGGTPEALRVAISRQQLYAFGSIPAFSVWYRDFSSLGSGQDLGLGSASIAGMQLVSGIPREVFRAYEDFVTVDTRGSVTNIYTVFRGLFLDIGVIGTAAIMSMLGFATGRVAARCIRGSFTAAVVLAGTYACVFMSAWMSILTFTSVVGAVVLAAAIVAVWSGRLDLSVEEEPQAAESRA